jgi:hypothetical protein
LTEGKFSRYEDTEEADVPAAPGDAEVAEGRDKEEGEVVVK